MNNDDIQDLINDVTELKSTEAVHKLLDIYFQTVKYGEMIIIKHEDKLTADVKVRNRWYQSKREE